MGTTAPVLSKADWNRYKSGSGRCSICGHTAVVSVSLTATELTGDRGGSQLVKEVIHFCHEHGILRYGEALNRLRGTNR